MSSEVDSLAIPSQGQGVRPAAGGALLRQRAGHLLRYLGPAFVVSVAYVDPGNFATNISGGSYFNYTLVWVILWSNLMAIFLQCLSAKLGIASGASLPQMCARHFSRRLNWFFWVVGVLAAMATTLAEFLGGALGLYLLFGLSLPWAGLLTGVITFVITWAQRYGQRVIEIIITAMVGVICAAYSLELLLAKPDWAAVGRHTLLPSLPDGQAVLIAVGMLGATVMPHVIFLHSQLVQSRNHSTDEAVKRRHYRLEQIDVALAMNIAFVVNAAMVIVSAAVFYPQGIRVDSIEQAHQSLLPLLGNLSGVAFAIALLAAGLSSAAVGAMAGETIIDGFVQVKLPSAVRRLATMAPAMVVIGLGVNPMQALVVSQAMLSFALPVAIVPLLLLTGRREIMGSLVNRPLTNHVGWLITALIAGLNTYLLAMIVMGRV